MTQGEVKMDKKKLNWTYSDDYFTKKTDVFKKVFPDAPDQKKTGTARSVASQVDLGLLDYETEYYETLRDNIVHGAKNRDEIPRLIALTGSDFGEGVSTIASKLAVSFALNADGPVLLVDSNFAKPAIHDVFGVPLSPGFGDVLQDGYDCMAAIKPSPIKNLFILPAGDIQTNPTPKYDTPMFSALLQSLQAEYRYVVFDTPPMQCDMNQCDMNSSVRLAGHLDGVILVLKTETVRREVAQRVKERLINANANVIGVVLNRAKHYIPDWLYKRL